MSQSGGGRSPYGGTMQPYGGANTGGGPAPYTDAMRQADNALTGGQTPSTPYTWPSGTQPRSTGIASPTNYGTNYGTGTQPRATPAPAGGGVWNPLDPGIATAGPSIMQAGSFGQPTSAMMGSGLLGMPSSNVQAAMSSRSSAQPGLVSSVGQAGANQMNNAFQAGGTQYHPWLNQLTDLGLQAPTAGAMANQWASEGLGTVGPGGQWQWAPGKGWDSATANVYGG